MGRNPAAKRHKNAETSKSKQERMQKMINYPRKQDIQLWIPGSLSIFQSIMPPISVPYPATHIAAARDWEEKRNRLLEQTGCKHTEEPEASIMEYIHGDKGYAILIRQNLIPDKNDEHFCWLYWHELGHFYAINTEVTDLHHYSDPGVMDDSRILEITANGPVLGLSNERLKQEGYWFWQEFIAEAISKFVSYKHRSTLSTYHPEQITWHPDYWGGIVDKLMGLLDSALGFYPSTIDEYSLAHYFANLLMDDFIVLYVKAAAEGKLMVYDEGDIVGTEPGEIEPTCISDIEEERFQAPLWRMKELLDKQMGKREFWIIDEDFLLEIGRCIGELMLAKIIVMAGYK